jgi:predicted esterase
MGDDSPLTGSFVAMSVFRPAWMPALSKAKDHPYFILHSPQDWIKIDEHARVAVKQLNEAGATARLQTYSGGHGWRDDPYGYIRMGVEWLEEQVEK